MQELFLLRSYVPSMAAKSRLRELREAAGLSVREVARQIGESHTNVLYWETSGNPPRSDVLVPMAKALGVTVEELLGEAVPRRALTPGGKLWCRRSGRGRQASRADGRIKSSQGSFRHWSPVTPAAAKDAQHLTRCPSRQPERLHSRTATPANHTRRQRFGHPFAEASTPP